MHIVHVGRFRRSLALLMTLVITLSLSLVSSFGQDVHAAGNPPTASNQKSPMAKPPKLDVGAVKGSPGTHPCSPHIKCVYAPPPPSGTAVYDTDPIIFVHGIQTIGSSTNCAGGNGVFTNTMSYLQSSGQANWHAGLGNNWIAQTGPLYTAGYYNNDTNCSMQLSTTGGDVGAGACNNMTLEDGTTVSNSNSSVGTTNEPIEHIACELSWYVYNGFSSTGTNVKLVTHSMGGLIVRYMIQKVGHDSHFAPYVYVSDAVTFTAPMGGLNNAQATDVAYICYCNQVNEMAYDPAYSLAPFMKAIYSNAHPNAANGTDWTMIGSLSNGDALDWDYQATTMSNSGGLSNNHRIGYSAVPDCSGQPSHSGWYGHGDYMNDPCEGFDASYYYCDGCSETQHTNFSLASRNAPHSVHEMLFAFTYAGW